MERLLETSDAINRVLYRIAMAVGWLFVVCTVVICFDVLSRKFGYQIPGMGSTRLQELEWHLHAALFCFWLGAAYVKNAHVRIDIAVAAAKPRTQAWIEVLGCVFFAIPYCLIAIYFSADFTWIAWHFNESSDSATGLPWRWIPKAFITLGLILLLVAVISVLMRLIVYLYGPSSLRARSAFAGAKAEHQEGAG
ncbi:MAG TPA: TRAP transporter small permease subunit [Burkholderiales bacterium]|nr:TRAP transporter small permease subunit [Burkholderiales bacterium]